MGLCAAALTFVVKDPAEPATAKDAPSPAPAAFALPAAYWKVFTILILFSIAHSSDTFLLLRAQNVGLSAWAVVAAYAMYNVLFVVFSYPAGVLSDRLGRWRVIAVGWVLYAGVYAGFALANATTIWPLFCVYGIYMALTDGVGKALIADVAPKAHRGGAIAAVLIGAHASASFGIAGATYLVGNSATAEGSFGAAFGGALLGGFAGFAGAAIVDKTFGSDHDSTRTKHKTTTVAGGWIGGSLVGYYMTRHWKASAQLAGLHPTFRADAQGRALGVGGSF